MRKSEGKPFAISKAMVWEAWRQVKANKGAPGVDGQDLAEFEKDLAKHLYKVWNRMSSGTWFPPAVRAVEVPKPWTIRDVPIDVKCQVVVTVRPIVPAPQVMETIGSRGRGVSRWGSRSAMRA